MAELFMNEQSGLLTADPGSGGTTLTSGNFAFLPAVAAPNYMRLVLNPDGLGGTAPEIVIVTAHTAAATTCTVTRGQETSFGGGAAVAHPIDTVWRHTLTRQSLLELTVPAGSINATVAATADAGYVFIDGSTITNGQTIYPTTWARIPASWKSAPDIVLPDWRGRTLFSDDAAALFTLGGLGGANTHTLIQAELPAVSLGLTGSTGVESVPHTHLYNVTGQSATVQSGSGSSLLAVYGTPSTLPQQPPSVQHTHPAGTLATANLGSGTAIDTRPAYGVVNFQLKVH